MAAKFKTYWYQESVFAKNAFLFNCRDLDLERKTGTRVERGEIVVGAAGLVCAEQIVPGLAANVVAFQPSRRCEWQGLELACMVHPNVPVDAKTKAELRDFNYAVAELASEAAVKLAMSLSIPVMPFPDGRKLINVELAAFERQGQSNPRRAKLI